MTLPTEPLKQNGTPPDNVGPRKAKGGLTVKIPALAVGVEYARVVVLIKTINAIAIAMVRNFLIKYTPCPPVYA
jgi:hypothetical protein